MLEGGGGYEYSEILEEHIPEVEKVISVILRKTLIIGHQPFYYCTKGLKSKAR